MQNRENEIAKDIVDAAFHIHVELGSGLLESAYEKILSYELEKRGHKVEKQVAISIEYDDHKIEDAFKCRYDS